MKVIATLICYEINKESISIHVCLCYEFLYIVKWIIKASFAGCEGFFQLRLVQQFLFCVMRLRMIGFDVAVNIYFARKTYLLIYWKPCVNHYVQFIVEIRNMAELMCWQYSNFRVGFISLSKQSFSRTCVLDNHLQQLYFLLITSVSKANRFVLPFLT